MGKSYTPKYRVEYLDNAKRMVDPLSPRFGWKTMTWDAKRNGAPTSANVERLRVAMNVSFLPGGVNEHVSIESGTVVHIYRMRLVHQKSGATVAETSAPAFELVA